MKNLLFGLRSVIAKTGLPLLLVLLPLGGSGAERNDGALWRPRFATPAIVALDSAATREFTAEVRALSSANDWSVIISNDLREWHCPLVSATYSRINRGTEPGWLLKASVPTNASPELFTLVISCNESVSVQHQALSVVPSFSSDFYLLHITDEQIVNQMHTDPSGQFWHMVGTWEEMKWMQDPVNLINPRFVIITGDQIDFNGALDGWNNWSNWGYKPAGKRKFSREETFALENRLTQMYKDCHRGYRVAYVETPGNHDVTPADKRLAGSDIRWHPISAQFYETEFGQRSYSFRMGDFYVLMHDWSDAGLKKWAAADYQASLGDSAIRYRLIGQHFKTDQAFVPRSCDLMLVGHGHTTETLQSVPYYIYEDGPSFKYGSTGFFNFHRTSDGWTCDQTRTLRDTARDVWPLFTANGETKTVRSEPSDPMNLRTNSVKIINDLPEQFYDGRVRFVLEHGNYECVSNGTILAQYDCGNATKTAVLVKVRIPAKGSVTVRVSNTNLGERLNAESAEKHKGTQG